MKSGRARVPLWAAVLGAGFLLPGCWGIAPLEKTGLVTLLGVDAAPRGGYLVTADIVTAQGSSNAPGVGGAVAVLLRQSAGSSLAEAVRRLRATAYPDLDFTHLEAIVVSEELARAGLATPLDYLASTPEVVTTPWLLVSRGQSAAAVLEALQPVKPRPDEVVIDTVTQGRRWTAYHTAHFFTVLKEIQLRGDEPATAGATVDLAPGGPATAGLRLTGEAMFRQDRMVGWLDGDAALGWVVGTARAHHPMVAVLAASGEYTIEIMAASRRVRISSTAGGPAASLDLRVTARLAAAQRVPAGFWSQPGLVAALRAAAARVLARDVLASVQAAQRAGADVFGLGEYVRLADPAAWGALAARWNQVGFARLPVAVRVHVALQSLGDNVCPILGTCGNATPPPY